MPTRDPGHLPASPQRKENLRKQHEWGDISDEGWRSTKRDIEAQLAGLPDDDKLVLFDRERDVLLSMAENLVRATPEQLQRLLARIVERVDTADREVVRVLWTPPARPFFAPAEDPALQLSCPQGALRVRQPECAVDALAWYATA